MNCQQTHKTNEVCINEAKYRAFWPRGDPLNICKLGKDQTNNRVRCHAQGRR